VDDLPSEARLIISNYVHPEHVDKDLATAAVLAAPGESQKPWPDVSLDDYLALRKINPVAAWTLVHGYSLNHMAVAGHWLQDPKLENINDRLIDTGIALNSDGNIIKESPDGRLKQSSSYSDAVLATFADGKQLDVPGAYIEFVERLVLPLHEQVPHSQRTEHQYRDGFEAANATHIFTSTDDVQQNQQHM